MTAPTASEMQAARVAETPAPAGSGAPAVDPASPELTDTGLAISARLLLIFSDAGAASEVITVARVVGFDCDVCDRQQALPFLQSNSYDGAILDVVEAGSDLELIEQARRSCRWRQVPIIVLADHRDVNAAFRAGASVAVARPVSPDLLRNTLGAIYRLALSQRRQYARYRVEIPLTLTVEDRKMEGKATDLGHGGMALVTADPLPLSALVSVRFVLPGSEEQIIAAGEVRWSDAHGRSGMCFESIAGAGRHALDNWIARRQAGLADPGPAARRPATLPPQTDNPESAADSTRRTSRLALMVILASFCLFVVGFWIYIACTS